MMNTMDDFSRQVVPFLRQLAPANRQRTPLYRTRAVWDMYIRLAYEAARSYIVRLLVVCRVSLAASTSRLRLSRSQHKVACISFC
jgi:hypothetical protein